MSDASGLRLVDAEAAEPILEPVGPKVFARSISAPPGPPWDQARAARLEARLGAPLPLGEVVFRLYRLEAWGFGRVARYAAAYVRARDIKTALDTVVEIDGRRLRVRFISAAEQRRRARSFGFVAGAAVISVLALGLALTTALTVRSDAAFRLDGLDQQAAVRLREVGRLEALKDQTIRLNLADVKGESLGDYLRDLGWAAQAKTPGAHINSIHWEHGLMIVEVRGDGPPFTQTDRTVVKAAKPVRSGVWLWGVGPAGVAAPRSSGDISAGPRSAGR